MTTAAALTPPMDRRSAPNPVSVAALTYIAVLAVAGVLGTAAVLKAISSGAGTFEYAVSLAELIVIGALVLLHTRWWAWAGVAAMFASFAGYTGYLLARGESSCGCFGDVSTPPIATLSIDLGMVFLATIVALARARSAAIIGGILTLAGVSAALGAGFGVVTSDPLPGDFKGDRAGMVLAASDFADADYTDPDRLVYIYDERAESKDEHVAMMRNDAAKHPDDPALIVRVLSAGEVEASAGVPRWAWEQLPAAILYRAGQVVERYVAETMPDPMTLRAERPVGPIARVLALPRYADIAFADTDLPVNIVYVYNPDCPICLQHLAIFNAYQDEHPNDPHTSVVPVSMHDIKAELDIEIWAWPGVPTSYIVRRGRVVGQTAGPTLIPNPYQIRLDLSMGRELRVPAPGAEHEGHDH